MNLSFTLSHEQKLNVAQNMELKDLLGVVASKLSWEEENYSILVNELLSIQKQIILKEKNR